MDLIKVCKKCEISLPVQSFSKASRNKDGLKNNCKACDKQNNKEYYGGNQEKKITKTREWQIKNKEKYFNYQLNYRIKNSEKEID